MTYESVVDVLDPLPLSVWRLDLECADRLRPEDGDAADVSMIFIRYAVTERMMVACIFTCVAFEPNIFRLDLVLGRTRETAEETN